MILTNAVNAGPFIYCMGYMSPHEHTVHNNFGAGHFHQHYYVVEGQMRIDVTHGVDEDAEVYKTIDELTAKKTTDLTDTRGMYHKVYTGTSGVAVMNFNPIPETRDLSVEIIHGPYETTITAGEKRITVVVIVGHLYANDKVLISMQYAKIFPGKQVDLVVPETCVCALVSEK